jgi:hypothetical protein
MEKEGVMRKVMHGMIVVMVAAGLMGCATMGGGEGEGEGLAGSPVVAVGNPTVPMDKKGAVQLMGAGFKPGQKINVLFTSKEGSVSNVSWALKPQPVPNDRGTWSTTFTYGRYVSKKMVKAGEAYVITVTDGDYNFLCQVPVAFSGE